MGDLALTVSLSFSDIFCFWRPWVWVTGQEREMGRTGLVEWLNLPSVVLCT